MTRPIKAYKDVSSGSLIETKHSGAAVVIDYAGCNLVTIKFISTGYVTVTNTKQIRSGNIKDPLLRSVYGVGYIGVGSHKRKHLRRSTPAYTAWEGMLRRCYDKAFQSKNMSYVGCTVCDEWHNFQVFADWFYKNHFDGACLDKDLIDYGNKTYSPEKCCLITRSLNSFLVVNNSKPLGKSWVDGKSKKAIEYSNTEPSKAARDAIKKIDFALRATGEL